MFKPQRHFIEMNKELVAHMIPSKQLPGFKMMHTYTAVKNSHAVVERQFAEFSMLLYIVSYRNMYVNVWVILTGHCNQLGLLQVALMIYIST